MGVQQAIARSLTRLPAPMLKAMAKNAVTEVDGRTLDPGMGALLGQAARGPGIESQSPREAREATRQAFALMNAPRAKGVGVTELAIPGPGGTLTLRHYWPAQGEASGALLVYFHMGGCVIGDLDACDSFCSQVCAASGTGVLSVDYRLAPEHPYPAAVEDALAAFRWVRDHASEFGGDAARIAVGGDSAGGMLAAIVAQETARTDEQGPVLQVLIYPWTDMTASGGSMESCAACAPLSAAGMRWFQSHYVPPGTDATAPRLSPGLADDLSGQPPALVYTAGFDPLRDQGEAYSRKLEAAGVPVTFREYADLPHGFTAMGGVSRRAGEANAEIVADIAGRLVGSGPAAA